MLGVPDNADLLARQALRGGNELLEILGQLHKFPVGAAVRQDSGRLESHSRGQGFDSPQLGHLGHLPGFSSVTKCPGGTFRTLAAPAATAVSCLSGRSPRSTQMGVGSW